MMNNALYEIKLVERVKVRKYEVDTIGLVDMLREAKSVTGISNKEIAEKLNIPITQVEHWFRKDKCSAIPPDYLWYEIKTLLGIKDTKYDKSIMEFIERDGVYDMGNRAYLSCGIAPTITTQCNNIKIVI